MVVKNNQPEPGDHAHHESMEHMLLAIPVAVQTKSLSEIESQLAMTVWGWLAEQYIDLKQAERRC